jgi:hypothetical protein
VERALAPVARILPLAGLLVRAVGAAALVALASATLIAAAIFRGGVPEPQAEALLAAVVAAGVFVPGAVLVVFHRTLRQVVGLPGRLRSMPGAGRAHADELARLARQRRGRLPRRAWRLLALGRSTRELLTPYAPLAPLLSVPFLVAAGVSLLVTPLLVLGALVALAALA